MRYLLWGWREYVSPYPSQRIPAYSEWPAAGNLAAQVLRMATGAMPSRIHSLTDWGALTTQILGSRTDEHRLQEIFSVPNGPLGRTSWQRREAARAVVKSRQWLEAARTAVSVTHFLDRLPENRRRKRTVRVP